MSPRPDMCLPHLSGAFSSRLFLYGLPIFLKPHSHSAIVGLWLGYLLPGWFLSWNFLMKQFLDALS